jgi:hypothetical protein
MTLVNLLNCASSTMKIRKHRRAEGIAKGRRRLPRCPRSNRPVSSDARLCHAADDLAGRGCTSAT